MLTQSVDTYTGTVGNDTFNSDVLTLTDDSTINGGNGVDTLNATLLGGTVAPTLNSVEKVFIEALGDVTVDASAFAGVQELWTRDSVGDLLVNGLTSSATVIGIKNTDQDVTVNYATSAIQGNTTVTVALDGAAGNTVTLGPDSLSTTNVVNTVVLNSVGTVANNLQALVLAGNGANDTARTLTVTGAQDLSITAALAAEVNVINAGNMAGDLTLAAVGDDDGLLFNGATMTGAANITVENGTNNGAVIRTGSGDDTITFDDLADAKLVNGGAGNDTLIATVNAANQAPVIQNVETLDLTFNGAGSSLDAAAISGANKINVVNVENGGSLVINNMNTSIANIDVLDTDVTAAATLGFRSTVTGNLTVTTGADDDVSFSGVTVANVGSLSIVNADNVLATGNLTLDNAKTTSLSVTNSSAGNGAVTVGTVGGNKLASLAVDALSGNVTVGNVTTQSNLSVNVKAENDRTVDTGNFNLVSSTADRALALTAAAAGTGVLTLDGAITAFGATLNVTSATGAVTVGTINTANHAGTASAAAVVNLTSTGGNVNIGNITADNTGGSIALDLSVLGAGAFGNSNATALDAFGDVTATLVSGTGNASFGAIKSAEGNIALNITSADGNVEVDAVEAEKGDVSVTINASDANSSNNNTVTLASLTGEKVTLNLVSDAAATVTNGIEATAAANTGRVIDVTLSGKGAVTLNALTASGAGNTTKVDASALEGALTVELSAVQDTVVLGSGADVITTSVAGSVFGKADWISGFSVAADTLVVKGNSVDYTIAKTGDKEVKNLGNMTTELTEANLAAFIGTALNSDKVGFLTVGGKSFLVINDQTDGFAAAHDAVIEVTGINFALGESLYYAV